MTAKKEGANYVRHGGSGTPEYWSWAGIRERCLFKHSKRYARYGGRGIKVCERWQKFENFRADMSPRPEGMTIDRIDNDGHYSCGKCEQCVDNGWPSNCKWSTDIEQASNTSRNVMVTHDGVTDTLSGWARYAGCGVNTLLVRLNGGWPFDEAIKPPFTKNKPHRQSARLEHDGESLTFNQWAKRSGTDQALIRYRIKVGWSTKDAIYAPVNSIYGCAPAKKTKQ